ncbi:hypothetical protein BLOT_010985 [Blomia tropicalis]|nr:hypothetical protein BLOT_010985 [Blomia tropicalis]
MENRDQRRVKMQECFHEMEGYLAHWKEFHLKKPLVSSPLIDKEVKAFKKPIVSKTIIHKEVKPSKKPLVSGPIIDKKAKRTKKSLVSGPVIDIEMNERNVNSLPIQMTKEEVPIEINSRCPIQWSYLMGVIID